MQEPKANRVVDDNNGTNKSLKLSIGKKNIQDNEDMIRIMYGAIIINGVQYCRRHLVLSCHLCEEDSTSLAYEVHAERERLGVRCGGDPMLNDRSNRWRDFVQGKQMEQRFQIEDLVRKYGKNHAQTHPQHWIKLMNELKTGEREINDRFLAEVDEVKSKGVTQCCYWACKTPNGLGEGKKLLKCAGCGIAKYCCKEHQIADWKWEHKGECTVNVPDWLNTEMDKDRLRNLNGDYEDYKM